MTESGWWRCGASHRSPAFHDRSGYGCGWLFCFWRACPSGPHLSLIAGATGAHNPVGLGSPDQGASQRGCTKLVVFAGAPGASSFTASFHRRLSSPTLFEFTTGRATLRYILPTPPPPPTTAGAAAATTPERHQYFQWILPSHYSESVIIFIKYYQIFSSDE